MNFFNKLSQNEIYKKIIKTLLSYSAGAMLMGVATTAHLAVFGKVWGIIGTFSIWGAKLFRGNFQKYL